VTDQRESRYWRRYEIYVETGRLILHEISEDDLQGIFDLDPDHGVHHYLGKRSIDNNKELKSVIAYIKDQDKKAFMLDTSSLVWNTRYKCAKNRG
jgi:hypothetical protein